MFISRISTHDQIGSIYRTNAKTVICKQKWQMGCEILNIQRGTEYKLLKRGGGGSVVKIN
jgi:hypothetical protein